MESIIAIIISGISTFIALISIGVTVFFNVKSQKQYLKSLEPELSFKLVEYKSMLFLQIINTGKSAAHDIKIDIKNIYDNGEKKELIKDMIFEKKFELYAGEMTQGSIALFGENICEHVFPKVLINVEYVSHITNKGESFERTVVFCPLYKEKIIADVDIDLDKLNSNIACLARANLRTANYLDGCQVAPMDELNIMAHKSLHDDLCEINNLSTTSNISDRKNTIRDNLRGKK